MSKFRPIVSSTIVRCVAAIALLVAARAHAANKTLQDCVQTPKPSPLAAVISNGQVGQVGDVGNVTVMELSGDYDRGITEPRQEVAAQFFATHPDQYDFLVVFTTFEFPTGSATAFYNEIRNDTDGIGQPQVDLSADFGSAGRLQGYIDMAAMSRYSFAPNTSGYQTLLGVLAHEIMHRWGVYIHFIDSSGNDSTDLLGLDGMHWSYFADSDASVMYGNDWQLQSDGKFHSVDVRHRYSPLDLYLAGFAAPSEVPPITLIRNGDGGVATDLPKLGAVSNGTGEQVTIDQIIAASGARSPSATDSQKDFTGAVILLKRPGENVSANTLLELERFRVRAEQQFVEMTGGRGTLRLYTKTKTAGAVTTPTILHGSGTTQTPTGVGGAVVWLESRQTADGHWQDRAATAMRDTVAVVHALTELDPSFSGLTLARSWIASHSVTNLDQGAWKLSATDADAEASTLLAAQAADGGFAIKPGWTSGAFDTALVANALAHHDAGAPTLSDALQFVGSRQNADGSYGVADRGHGRVLPTLRAALLLANDSNGTYTGSTQQAADWIASQQAADGGIGGVAQASLVDTVEVYSLLGRLPLSGQVATGTRDYIRQNQQLSGDWGGSVYLTATAALAYAHDQSANLAVSGALSIDPARPFDGELTTLSATVTNTGNVPAPTSIARWYDGDPDQGGLQIGTDIAVPNLAAGSSAPIAQQWDTGGRAGDHTLWLVLDADDAVTESSEQDNRASLSVNVQPPPDAPDLALNPADFTLDPASVTTLPTQVHLSGSVRNLGTQDIHGAVIRLYAKPDLTQALAEVTTDVPARGSASVAMDFDVTTAATLDLLVRGDPDNAIAEADEANNDAELTLPFGQSLDLEVTAADISQATGSPVVGQDTDFNITLHNRGTVDSPPAVFHAEVVQNGVTTTLFDAPLQIPAGQSLQQQVVWRPSQPGAAQLRVSIDPDSQVAETNEDNNAAQFDFSVAALTQADLTFVGGSLAFLPTPGLQGQPLSASLGVRNLSSVASGSFRVALYASDPGSGAPELGSTMVSGLAGSTDTAVTIDVADLEISGDQTLYAKIDADDQIAEVDETNNVIIAPLHVVPLPDVAISVADMRLIPALPVPGQSVEAQITVKNLGGQDANNVVVRLLEGGATDGVPVGPDQTIGTLAAGAETTLTWDWTLGVAADAHSVTAIADPDDTVHEGSEDNNVANLPYDTQSGNFFASERYISPNGDGVQDETAVLFVMPQAGDAEIDVVNGAQYTVRHFTNVQLNADLRGEVIWNGRDDHGRIVPDGDYHFSATGSAGQLQDGPIVTVDNNRSSFLEAVDTPYGIYGDLPRGLNDQPMYNTQIPPITSPLHDQLFGFFRSPTAGTGLYRTSTLFPDPVPILSGNWLTQFKQQHGLQSANIDRFAFSPDGRDILVGIAADSQYWLVTTAVDQIDSPHQLVAVDGQYYAIKAFGYFDQDSAVVGPDSQGLLQLIDVPDATAQPLRSYPDIQEFDNTPTISVLPDGILFSGVKSVSNVTLNDQFFLPRDSARPQQRLNSIADYTYYNSWLSPHGTTMAVSEGDGQQDKFELVDLATGQRQQLASKAPDAAAWLESQNTLLVADAAARSLTTYSESGQRLSVISLPPLQRVGQYLVNDEEFGISPSDPANIFPDTPKDLIADQCDYAVHVSNAGTERQIYDPTTNRFFVSFGETVGHNFLNEDGNYELTFEQGIQDFFSADIDDKSIETLQQDTLTPLIESADVHQHPLRTDCDDSPAPDWPSLILADGARVRRDGHVQTLSKGVSPKLWADRDKIQKIWPDDTRMLLSTSRTYSSLLNSTAVLQARTLGRGIELTGVAADRNFDYYQLDWAPVDDPNNWRVLTPASSDQVFLDEFLTWVPPQPGTFVVRLTLVDKAGNRTTASATGTAFDSSLIDSFSLAPRYISPNGDGVQDQLDVHYNVRAPLTLEIHIDDENGNTVRAVSTTYGSGSLGPQEFVWDGRDDGGQIVPDGRYRLNVDGFAAWVTVDTTAPTISGSLKAPYQPNAVVEHDIKYEYVGHVANATYVVRDDNLSSSGTQRALKTGGPWQPTIMDGVVDYGQFGAYDYRIVASDQAGNSSSLDLGPGEEQLIATGIRVLPLEANAVRRFRYQPPPFSTPLDVNMQPPIEPIEVDQAADDLVGFVDQSGYLRRVAVETAPSDQPNEWTERGIGDVDNECGPHGCYAPLNTLAMPLGGAALVRLRGERADGTYLYSNQGYIKVGGIDPPVCDQLDGSDVYVHADEYFDGPLASATLHFTSNTGVASAASADPITQTAALFKVPADPHSEAWVEGVDQRGFAHVSKSDSLGCSTGTGGSNSEIRFTVQANPVITHDQCDGQPSNEVALGFYIDHPIGELGGAQHSQTLKASLPAHVKLSYVDGITNLPVTLFEGDADDSNFDHLGQLLRISTANWPEGTYQGRLDVTDAHGVHSETVAIPVLRQPPQSQITTPISGQRVCTESASAFGQAFPMGVTISSPAEFGYRVEIGSGSHPLSRQCVLSSGLFGVGDQCPDLTHVTDLTNTDSGTTEQVIAAGDLQPYNGVASLRLRSVGWSGGSTCVDSTVYLDSDVEFVQRKEPTTQVPIPGVQQVGVSAVGDPTFAQARFYFTAREPVNVTAELRRDGTTESIPLLTQDGVEGDLDVVWDGMDGSAFAADGTYQFVLSASDGCGHPKEVSGLGYSVLVDSTPPDLQLVTSASGGTTAQGVIEISGSATDNGAVASWSLDYALGDSPDNWQNLASGTSPVPNLMVLKDWSRGSITGSVDIRLSAVDELGNRSETHVPLTLLDPAKLINGAELQPALFSPNGDGANDATRVQLSLLRHANVDVTVQNAAHATIASLFSGDEQPGSNGFVWDGRANGQVVADGTYSIVINATDPDGVASPETATLTATVDTVAPSVEVLQPAGDFAAATASVRFHAEDPHFTSYEASLTRVADGVVVASTNGTQGGDITLTALQGFQEGGYALHIVARDGAGNVTTKDQSFQIDATPPEVDLSAPADAALLPSATATSVTGRVNDAHLASYTLSVTPQGSETWTDLTQGTANVDEGEVLSWTPNLPDGQYQLRLRATDQAGNTTDVIHGIEIDGTPPVAQITAPHDGDFVSSVVELDGSATDAHLANYRISLATTTQAASGQWTDVYTGTTAVDNGRLARLTLNLPQDNYVLRLTATDLVGLSSTDQVNVRIDTQPPPVPINLTGKVQNHTDSVLDWNAVNASDLAGYFVYRGGEKITPTPVATNHYVDAGAPEGQMTYYVTAVDHAGNESAPSNSVTLLVDHTPPTVAISLPSPAERVRGVYDIVGTAYSQDDFKQYRLSVEQLNPPGGTTPLASGTLPVQGQTLASWNTLGIADETTVRIHLEGEDTSGNIATADVDVVVDNNPPAAPTGLTAVLNGADAQTNWNPNSESDLLGYLLYRDNQLVNATSPTLPADLRPFALTDTQYLDQVVPDGTHTYVVYAIDRAGNVSPPSAPATLDPIDNHPPSMTIESPAANTKFDTSITVLATSPDSDIAQVQFAWRAQGDTTWTNFGSALTEAPYRVVWTPPNGSPYGTYQIRALAQDLGGLQDPNPPVVDIIYADLTAPDAPTNLTAVADADTVHVAWSASTATDVTAYHVYRGTSQITSVSATTLSYDDASRPDGAYTYTVVAVDGSNNDSDPSNAVTAHVFGVSIDQPYSPTSQGSFELHGTSARPGDIALHVDTDSGSTDLTPGSTGTDGTIDIPAQALVMGDNHFTVRVTDAGGNRSRSAEIWVDRGGIPAAPTGLAASVVDYDVTLNWNANSESDLLGYRVFRNGQVLAADAPIAETPTATSSAGQNPGNAVDGNPTTYWLASTSYADPDASPNDPALEIDWSQLRVITAVNLNWLGQGNATGNVDLYAWSGHTWIGVARMRGPAQQTQSVVLDRPYATTRLKLVVHDAFVNDDGGYHSNDLTEVQLTERPVQSATTLTETLTDGTYHYQVSAISDFAFESPLSDPADAAVGDTQGPDPVTLSGSLTGNDANLSWTASQSADVARYDLQRDGNVITSVDTGNTLAYTDANLTLGAHDYVVVAYDGFGNAGAPSNTVTLTVTGTPPSIPVNVTVSAPAGGGALDVSWQPGPGNLPASYVLLRATAVAGPYTVVTQPTGTSYHDAPLVNGTTYYYEVEAVDSAGNLSAPSDPASGTPYDNVPPSAPTLTFPTDSLNPVFVDADSSQVCGSTEPGATVQIDRDGSDLDSVTAATAFTTTSLTFNTSTTYPLIAPDGEHVALINYNDGSIHVINTESAVEATDLAGSPYLEQWAAHGTSLYYFDQGASNLYRWRPGETSVLLPQPVTSVGALAVNAQETSFALIGDYVQANGDTVKGVWLVDASSGAVRGIDGIDLTNPNAFLNMFWSPDGRYLVVADTDGHGYLVEASSAQIIATPSMESWPVAWDAAGAHFAFARSNAQSGDDLLVYDVQANAETLLSERSGYLFGLAWSPVNSDTLAVLDASSLDILSVQNNASILPLPYANADNWYDLTWTPSGRLFADGDYSALRVDPPGWFCDPSVALLPGANHISAAATDSSGNRSANSFPIELDTPTQNLPDLAVATSDIFFLPPAGMVGQDFSALITLHNLGTLAVDQPVLRVTLTAPDGSQTTVEPVSPLGSLAPAAAESATFDLGTLTQAGTYRIDAAADPFGTLTESDEDNNNATSTLVVSSDANPSLELELSRSVFAPGDAVDGDVTVTNPGNEFSGHVHLSVSDSDGVAVADLGDLPIAALGYGQHWSEPVNWDATGVLAGDYQMHATLFDADGATTTDQTVSFTITAVRHVQLTLTPDAATHTIGDDVGLSSVVDFSDGNAPLSGATLRVSARDPDGNEVWHVEQTLGTLLPGAQVKRNDTWPTPALSEGVYTLTLSVDGTDFSDSTDSTVTLAAATPTVVLSGTLAFDPAATLIAGDNTSLNYSVSNQGQDDLTGVQARVRIVTDQGQVPVSETDASFDLVAGTSAGGTISLTAPPLKLTSYAAILEARLSSDPPDQWRLLAQQGFTIVDLLPPDITILSPADDVLQPAVVPLSAAIVDLHSAVADAEVSVDGGTWQPVSAASDGNYRRGLSGLADGVHTLVVRASDTWGNQAESAPRTFTVDATPPLITIDGVSDGDVVNHTVTPVVTITDDHLDTSEVRLNSDLFTSGTIIDTDGDYILAVRATDDAGNQSTVSVRFTIDRVAPVVAIASPANDDIVYQSSVHVDVQSEAGANVTLGTGSYQASAVADADGHAGFDDVPLVEGNNAIAATAKDAAGNVGGPASINVVYQIVALAGSLGPLNDPTVLGTPLTVPYALQNVGSAPLTDLPVRIELSALDSGDVVLDDDFTASVPVGDDTATTRQIDTTSLTAGDYSIALLANLPGGSGGDNWTTLDTVQASIIDRPCHGVSNDVIFADGFEPGGAALSDDIFCNGFELPASAASTNRGVSWLWLEADTSYADMLLASTSRSPKSEFVRERRPIARIGTVRRTVWRYGSGVVSRQSPRRGPAHHAVAMRTAPPSPKPDPAWPTDHALNERRRIATADDSATTWDGGSDYRSGFGQGEMQ